MTLSTFLKVAEHVDVAPLLAQLGEHPELWGQHGRRKTAPGSPHVGMSDIWVRYRDAAPFEATGKWAGFNDEHHPIWYPAWRALPALRPIVFGIMALVDGEELGGVLITRIPPGEAINPHTDDSWHVRYFRDKFYLSLRSAPGTVFGCERDGTTETINPAPGDLYRFDNRPLHWVRNDSAEDRITLIVCIRTDKFAPYEVDA